MLQKTLCFSCDAVISESDNPRARKSSIKGRTLCPECRSAHVESMAKRNKSQETRNANSLRMTLQNPMSDPVVRAKVASTISGTRKTAEEYLIAKKDIPRETKEQTSERMKLKNPMSIPLARASASKTMKERIELGEITYKKGPDHHLWKGNRDFNNTCRCQLYPAWTKKILHRDSYSCTRCQSSNVKLQVHHTVPLREIIQEVRERHGIDTFMNVPSSEWQPYIEEVLSMHKMSYGITVCGKCHAVIDKFYREKKEL